MTTTQEYRLSLVKERTLIYGSVFAPEDAVPIIRDIIGDRDRECLVVLSMSARHKVIGVNIASIGSLEASIVNVREIFKFAILSNAKCLIIGHNHPSGDTSPSRDDIATTRKICEASRFMDIELLDHIIIGDGHYSMKQGGDIEW